jgi:membrane associated rhomboid family serine protease
VLWIIIQIVCARFSQLAPQSGGIAYISHLGGAAAGVIAGIFFKSQYRKDRPDSGFLQKLYSRINSSND